MFASLKTRVETLSRSIPTFLEDLSFRQILIVFMTKHSQQSCRKMERGPEYVISQVLKQKRETWKISLHAAIFFSRYEQ